jgi:hypothetical protein
VAALPPSPALDWLAARIALGLGDPETARTKVTQALASPGLSPDQQAEVALLLGEALDALGRPAEAFAAFAHGKQALRGLYAERAAGRESEVGKLNRLADWFAAADPAPWRVAPVETPASAATPSWSASRVPARRCWSRRSPAIRISSAWRRRRRWPRPTMR